MPAPKTRATKPATAKKGTAPQKAPAATKPKPTTAPAPAPALDKITDKDVVRLWLKGRKGCWVGVLTKVDTKELTFCVRWHKDQKPVQVVRADIDKLEVKTGNTYAVVAI